MMDRTKFTENLLLYGADIHQWPEEAKKAGLAALEVSTEIQGLYREHARFEEVLRGRRYEEPSKNLAQKIIAKAVKQEKQSVGLGTFISALLNDFHFHRPALSKISVVILMILIIGFAIGFLNPLDSSILNAQEETNLQSFLYDEGGML